MPNVRYIGPHDEVEVGRFLVKRGDYLSVPKDVAGRPPTDESPGEGLLAQPENWLLLNGEGQEATDTPSGRSRSRKRNGEATAGSGEPAPSHDETQEGQS